MMSLNTLEFLGGQAARSVRRNPLVSMAAVTNVAVALCVLGAFFLTALNLDHLAQAEAQAAVITCELAPGAKPADVEAALVADRRVKLTEFRSKDENLRMTARRLGYDYEALKLLPNPLPDTIIVHVNDPRDIEAVTQTARRVSGVRLAWYPREITGKLLAVAHGVKIAGLVVGLILVVAALTVISTTIRLTIYARRREIRIMQLVGATRGFIRLPFLLEGIFYGWLGGVVAAVVLLLGYTSLDAYVAENIEFLRLISGGGFLTLFGVGLTVCGAVFGAVGSMTGISRYLRLV